MKGKMFSKMSLNILWLNLPFADTFACSFGAKPNWLLERIHIRKKSHLLVINRDAIQVGNVIQPDTPCESDEGQIRLEGEPGPAAHLETVHRKAEAARKGKPVRTESWSIPSGSESCQSTNKVSVEFIICTVYIPHKLWFEKLATFHCAAVACGLQCAQQPHILLFFFRAQKRMAMKSHQANKRYQLQMKRRGVEWWDEMQSLSFPRAHSLSECSRCAAILFQCLHCTTQLFEAGSIPERKAASGNRLHCK